MSIILALYSSLIGLSEVALTTPVQRTELLLLSLITISIAESLPDFVLPVVKPRLSNNLSELTEPAAAAVRP